MERMKKVGRVAVMLYWEGGGAAGSGGEWQVFGTSYSETYTFVFRETKILRKYAILRAFL